MPVVWSERHRGHTPDGGYWLGVREAGDEEPVRGEMLRDGLVEAGAALVEPPDLGCEPILAVHDADFVDFMARAYPAWVAEGHLTDPGQPHVVGYLFANPGYAARYRKARRPATIRAELGLFAIDTMTLISEGTFDAACAAVHASAHAADLVADGERAAYAAVRPPGHHAGPAFFGGSC
jgi:acetoin utilization deacetylase AcuC-like enzyme